VLGLIAVLGLSLVAVASLVAEHGLWGVWAQSWRHVDPVASRPVGSSQTRARTCVPCTGRRILSHQTARKVPLFFFFKMSLFFSQNGLLSAHLLLGGLLVRRS